MIVVDKEELKSSFAVTLVLNEPLSVCSAAISVSFEVILVLNDPLSVCKFDMSVSLELMFVTFVAILVAILADVAVNDPLMSVANCAEPLTSVGLFIIFANGTEPDTIWPPLATTTCPEVADENVTLTVFTLLTFTVKGINWLYAVS